MRKNLPALVSCVLAIEVFLCCFTLGLSFRFAVSQSPFKRQQTKHKNKSCKNLSTGWIHTFAIMSRCPLPGMIPLEESSVRLSGLLAVAASANLTVPRFPKSASLLKASHNSTLVSINFDVNCRASNHSQTFSNALNVVLAFSHSVLSV